MSRRLSARGMGQLSNLTRRLSVSDSAADRSTIKVRHETPVFAMPAMSEDTRPRAAGREPCPYCATRGDLGCEHFAPCNPGDIPKTARGLTVRERHMGLS